MGWADLLFTLGIPYDSQEAHRPGRSAHGVREARRRTTSAAQLAEERGPFPNWNRSIYRNGRPLRNSTVTTIAPTGTISMIAGCSSGIEPIFALAFEHRVKEPGRRARADLRQRDVRAPGQAAGLLLRRPDGRRSSRRGIAARHPRRAARRRTRGLQDLARDRLRVARAPSGRLPAVTPTTACRKTINLPNDADRGGRGERLSPGVGAGLPRHHGLPRRLQGRAGAQRRACKDKPAAARRGVRAGAWSSRGRTACRARTYRRRRRSAPPSSPSTRPPTASRSRCSCRSARADRTPWRWPRRWGGLISLMLRLPFAAVALSAASKR